MNRTHVIFFALYLTCHLSAAERNTQKNSSALIRANEYMLHVKNTFLSPIDAATVKHNQELENFLREHPIFALSLAHDISEKIQRKQNAKETWKAAGTTLGIGLAMFGYEKISSFFAEPKKSIENMHTLEPFYVRPPFQGTCFLCALSGLYESYTRYHAIKNHIKHLTEKKQYINDLLDSLIEKKGDKI